MRNGVQQGKTGKRKDTAMQYNQGRSRSTTIASMLGLAIALSMGVVIGQYGGYRRV